MQIPEDEKKKRKQDNLIMERMVVYEFLQLITISGLLTILQMD